MKSIIILSVWYLAKPWDWHLISEALYANLSFCIKKCMACLFFNSRMIAHNVAPYIEMMMMMMMMTWNSIAVKISDIPVYKKNSYHCLLGYTYCIGSLEVHMHVFLLHGIEEIRGSKQMASADRCQNCFQYIR